MAPVRGNGRPTCPLKNIRSRSSMAGRTAETFRATMSAEPLWSAPSICHAQPMLRASTETTLAYVAPVRRLLGAQQQRFYPLGAKFVGQRPSLEPSGQSARR
jgi:hypothetical protein